MNGFASRMLPAAIVALLLAATSFGIGIATAGNTAHTAQALKPNVIKNFTQETATSPGLHTQTTLCSRGYQVISGGYIQGGHRAIVLEATMVQRPHPGFTVKTFEGPFDLTPGSLGNQDYDVTVVAYCAPIGKPVVFGKLTNGTDESVASK